jgi:ATP-binding cassette subfamily B protein
MSEIKKDKKDVKEDSANKTEIKTDLISKLPLKSHLRNVRKVLKVVQDMNQYYIPMYCVVHLLHVINNYMSLILSAYILNALGSGKFAGSDSAFAELFTQVLLYCVGMFMLRIIEYGVMDRVGLEEDILFKRFQALTEQKMLEMDFSQISSPTCDALRHRIQEDTNWESGIYQFIRYLNHIIFCGMNLVGAIVVGIPSIKLLVASGQYVVFPIVLALAVISVFTTKMSNKYAKAFTHALATGYEDDGLPIRMGWDFANNTSIYKYQNGKDVRIYGGSGLLKRYVLDNWDAPENKAVDRKIAICKGKSGFCYVVSGEIIEKGAYLLMAVLALAGKMPIGDMVKYAGCIMTLFGDMDRMVKIIPDFFQHVRKHMSTMELLEMRNEQYQGTLPVEKRSDRDYRIEFRNVSFRYPGSDRYALKNFSMKLQVGEKLAVVGMNGSGKTTMIKLLCRLYDPEEGEILLNGVDIRKFRQEEYRELFSVVFQDFQLFSFTLGENVASGSDFDKEKAEKCLIDVGLGSRMKKLREGANTYLYKDYEDGEEISGGEAQKIAIARAVYKNAPFILLDDEPTAALDPISEYDIYTSFDRIIGDNTAVYISHRLSSCRFCEKIAVFHEGCLVQMGSHKELLEDMDGKYYELWNAQAQYYQ